MKIYLASRYSRHEEMLEIAKELRMIGHIVTSRWIAGGYELKDGTEQEAPRFALEDMEDIFAADALALFIDDMPSRNRAGKDVEFGYALGLQKRLFHIGLRTNVFTYLPRVEHFDTVDDFIGAMEYHANYGTTDGYTRTCAVCGSEGK